MSDQLVSVVVPTCADATAAVRCVTTIREHASGTVEVIVVENRPEKSCVSAALTEAFGPDSGVRYIEEPTPGLSRARNAGLAVASGSIVAFPDDDVVVDEYWLESLRDAFATYPDAVCVTGRIEPLELGTRAQSFLEQFATYDKGDVTRVYRLDAPPEDIPLFPYTAGHFGSGANMAFRRDALVKLRGFDPLLGAGTRARGGEDLDICIRVLLSGDTLVYEPRAVVRHPHPDTMRLLHQQAFNYGAGLGALVAKHLTIGPNRTGMIRRIPAGLGYLFGRGSRKNSSKQPDFPRRLELLEVLGLVAGAIGYLRTLAGREPDPERRADPTPLLPRRVWSGELDLASPVIASGRRLTHAGVPFDEARLLIRVLGEPVGFVQTPLLSGELTLQQVLADLDSELAHAADHQLASNNLPSLAVLIAGAQSNLEEAA